jgi:hypothetical protein
MVAAGGVEEVREETMGMGQKCEHDTSQSNHIITVTVTCCRIISRVVSRDRATQDSCETVAFSQTFCIALEVR